MKARGRLIRCRLAGFGAALFLAVCPAPGGAAVNAIHTPSPEPARLSVRGHGWLGNLRLKQQLRVLFPEGRAPEWLDAHLLEDAALLLLAALQREGYLRPRLDAEIVREDGATVRHPAGAGQPLELPRDLRARRATFRLHRGTFYYYARLEFPGLSALPASRAATYFLVPDLVLPQKKTKAYTPAGLNRGLANLREELRRLGWREAAVEAAAVETDHASGRVSVVVRVTEGRRFWVTQLETRVADAGPAPPGRVEIKSLKEPFSSVWEQDLLRSLKNAGYAEGFPDTGATLESEVVRETADTVEVRVRAEVRRGPRVRLGAVAFEGLERTRESLVRKRARLVAGAPLNRLAVDAARFQLLRLGVFDRVDADIAPPGAGDTRAVRFQVRESRPREFSVLAGYGSYDLLWGGVELEQLNLFGLAHRQRLLFAQSFKSTKLEYAYTIPQVFDPLGELTGLGFYRRRQETTFTREEYGASLGYRRLVPRLQGELGLRLAFEQLATDDREFNPDYGLQRARAAAAGFTLDHNRTDNPLYPLRGHRLYATAELATEALGGEANYGRFELGGSWHRPLNRSLIFHAGAAHAFVVTPGAVAADLPFNKRFFLGGASSLRGYVQGEAASFDPAGKLVGDESYLLGQLELEQRLTPRWSLVGFLDGAGIARDLADYPAGEVLASVGAGIRWRTPVGPVRLEYGHNLNRRDGDPSGTVHFSVGFPF